MRDPHFKPVTNIREDLRAGDIIRNTVSANAYVVTAVFSNFAIAVDTIHVSNPDEWLVLRRHRVRRNRS